MEAEFFLSSTAVEAVVYMYPPHLGQTPWEAGRPCGDGGRRQNLLPPWTTPMFMAQRIATTSSRRTMLMESSLADFIYWSNVE